MNGEQAAPRPTQANRSFRNASDAPTIYAKLPLCCYSVRMRPILPLTLRAWFLGLSCATVVTGATCVTGCANGGDENATPIDYDKPDASTTDGSADGSAGDAGCVPKTCVQLAATCGSAPDGCGGKVECGSCPNGQICGGGGANKCGTNACAPKTCVQLEATCGYVSDGCSQAIDCGKCQSPYSCGGGGRPNQCGCVAKSCAQLGASCGSLPDGCEGKVDCGACPAGQTCGGGNAPNTCGGGTCTPKTCSQLGASCGYVSDGCSQALNCGTCSGTDVCGGGGKPNQCGCTPKTCVQLGASCGQVDNGCGALIDCGSCPPGETCGGSGVPGQCGCTCSAPNASTSCSGGVCSISQCDAGWADCDGDVVNGCETDIRTSTNHCGACNNPCNFTHADAACVAGQCVLGQCENGFANCDGIAATGCETDTLNDANHCGSCTKVCDAANGTPDCSGGVCGVQCNPGWGDCNASVTDGCETDLTSNVHHCGSCSLDCLSPAPSNVAQARCASSACAIIACNPASYDQNGQFADGCECIDDSVASTCGASFQVPPGTLGLGASADQAGTLVPTGDEDWFVINFSGQNTCGFHPRVTIEDQSGTGSIRIDVATDCAGAAIPCSEGGTSAGQIEWEFTFRDTCGTNLACDPAKMDSSPTTVYIRVYATAPSTTCLPYVLHISN